MFNIDTALAYLKSKIPGVIAFPPTPVSPPPPSAPTSPVDTHLRSVVDALALVLRSIAHGKIVGNDVLLSSRSVLTKFGLQEGPVLIKKGGGQWGMGTAVANETPPVLPTSPEAVPSERLRIEWMSGDTACKAIYDPRALSLRYYRGGTTRPALVVPQTTLSEAQFIALVDQLKSLP